MFLGRRVHLDSCSSSASSSAVSTGRVLGTKPKPLNLIVTNTNGCESTSTENDGLSNPRKKKYLQSALSNSNSSNSNKICRSLENLLTEILDNSNLCDSEFL